MVPFYLLHKTKYTGNAGFSLLQIAMMLVIIGLIVGGILVGGNLIDVAAQRAQIAQIDKYNSAVNLFLAKYNYLPGDIPNPYATNNGFQTRGLYNGEGDGNGVIEGNCSNAAGSNQGYQGGCGEIPVFWQDLSTAGMLDFTIKTGTNYPNISTNPWPNITLASAPAVKNWLPSARLGNGQYVYVMSMNGNNYFVVQKVSQIGWNIESTGVSNAAVNAMTVQQAYNMDNKIDDGLPQSGNVIACDADYDVTGGGAPVVWAAGSSHQGAGGTNCSSASTTATSYQTYNCYDNNGVTGTQTYSILKNANALNCALSFQFQSN